MPVQMMPSLRKQNVLPEPEPLFDEEREQQLLEEARKKKERAMKIREQQEKMLAKLKAKKDEAEKLEEDKRRKQEKKLAKAREQVIANYEKIETVVKLEDDASNTDPIKSKPKKFFDDKTCL